MRGIRGADVSSLIVPTSRVFPNASWGGGGGPKADRIILIFSWVSDMQDSSACWTPTFWARSTWPERFCRTSGRERPARSSTWVPRSAARPNPVRRRTVLASLRLQVGRPYLSILVLRSRNIWWWKFFFKEMDKWLARQSRTKRMLIVCVL